MAIPWELVLGIAKSAVDQSGGVADRFFSLKEKEVGHKTVESDNSRLKSLSSDLVKIEEGKLKSTLREIESEDLKTKLDHDQFLIKSRIELIALQSDIDLKDRQMNLIEEEARLRIIEAKTRLISNDVQTLTEKRDLALRITTKTARK